MLCTYIGPLIIIQCWTTRNKSFEFKVIWWQFGEIYVSLKIYALSSTRKEYLSIRGRYKMDVYFEYS